MGWGSGSGERELGLIALLDGIGKDWSREKRRGYGVRGNKGSG